MSAGLIDLKRKASFSLFLQKVSIFGKFLTNSAMKAYIGLKSPFSPFAKICAKYFESFDRRESASLGDRPKCFMRERRKSSRSESAADTYRLGSMSLIVISAEWRKKYSLSTSAGGSI